MPSPALFRVIGSSEIEFAHLVYKINYSNKKKREVPDNASSTLQI